MTQQFFEHPILNWPYGYPACHWELVDGQPTNKILQTRRRLLLVVTLEDGETVHNAFFDRNFRKAEP